MIHLREGIQVNSLVDAQQVTSVKSLGSLHVLFVLQSIELMHKKNCFAAGRRIFRRARINVRHIKYNISAKVNVKKR